MSLGACAVSPNTRRNSPMATRTTTSPNFWVKAAVGEVYAAEDTRLGRRVALKVLSRDLAMDADRRERFEREARAVAALNHPNIVTIYSVEEADGVPFLTLELVEGRTLEEPGDSQGA